MGVYIKGMEMPTDGELLCINIHPDGKVCINIDLDCKRIATAVPVPPHGKIIDADMAYRAIKGWLVKFYAAYEKDGKDERIAALLELDLAIRKAINDAPTIIEEER
jgi:hypothetical protein